MTFDELMKKHNGVWENGVAVVQMAGGYYWRVATGSPDKYELTGDGKRILGAPAKVVAPPEPVANMSANVVPSEKRKWGRKAKADDFTLDDI